MTPGGLRRRVQARDRLVALADAVGLGVQDQALGALRDGDLGAAEQALLRSSLDVQRLAENLRVYQAELHAQADELAASEDRNAALVSRFAALFAHMPVAALLVGMNGEIRDHNARTGQLFALRPQAASARFLHRLVDPRTYQERVRPAFHAAAADGHAMLETVPFIAEDGRRFTGELHLSRLPAQPGEAPSFACTAIDRSEHIEDLRALREAGAALRESETSLAEATQVARIGGWDIAADRAMRWSPAMRELFALPADAPADLDAMLALCDPEWRAALRAALDAALLQGRPFELELDMTGAGGRAMRVLAVGHADAEAGAPQRVVGVFQDITRQHQARRRIGELTERLNIATDAGGIGIWDWDLAHRHLFLDPRMCELLGVTQTLAADLPAAFAGRLADADAARLRQALDAALRSGEPLSLELPLHPAAGAPAQRWLHVTGRLHDGGEARTARLVGCAWDCSAEHEAARLLTQKEAAEAASRSKSSFLSRVSHELRTPLNAILGFSQLMRMEADHGDLTVKPHRVRHIENAARHLLDLINEVLDVSRIEAGRLELSLQPLDLHAAVADCLPLVQAAADAAGLHIDDLTAPPAPAQPVLADPLRLKEVLLNLLSNAVKYNRPGGCITLRARTFGDRVELDVADTGRGLDAQQLESLFQPFNRLGAEASGIEGAGMGLFVSQRFAELMGGSLRAASRPGEGAIFTLSLHAPH